MSEMAERFLKLQNPTSSRPQRGETSVTDARDGHDAQLTETAQDFDQDEDIGRAINQKLANNEDRQHTDYKSGWASQKKVSL